MIIGINICRVITIICDTNTINMTFYLLKVQHTHTPKKKKCLYCRIIQKIESGHFIISNYFLYFIPTNFLKKYLRVGTGLRVDPPMSTIRAIAIYRGVIIGILFSKKKKKIIGILVWPFESMNHWISLIKVN